MVFSYTHRIVFSSFKSFIAGLLLFSSSDKKQGRVSTPLNSAVTAIQPFSCLLDGSACTNGFPV